jgi:type II secretory pathway pseudopilin PulG
MKVRKKGGFSILATLIVVLIFSYLSISIINNQTFTSQIDKLKYLEIQSSLHILNLENFIKTHSKDEILNYKLTDDRFILQTTYDDNNGSLIKNYYIKVSSKNDNVSICKTIKK